MIAAAAVFGGMHGEHRPMIWPGLFDANHGAGGQPIVRVDYLEVPETILFMEEMPDKRLAHFLSFIEEAAMGIEKAVMVPDALDLARTTAAVPRPGKNMHIVSLALQRRRQFGDVRGNPTD
jgi:hypothetical protein